MGLVTVAVQRFRERFVRGGPFARERSRRSRLRGEITVAYFAEALGRYVSDHREDHLVRVVCSCHEALQVVARVFHQRGFAAQYVVSQGRALEHEVLEIVENAFRGRVLVGVDLIDDDVLLLFQLLGRECGVEDDVRDQLGRFGQVGPQRRRMDHGFLLGRVGVQLASEVFEAAVDMIRAPSLGPLEESVFEQMSHAVFGRLFVAASGADRQRAMDCRRADLLVNAANAVAERISGKFHRNGFERRPLQAGFAGQR